MLFKDIIKNLDRKYKILSGNSKNNIADVVINSKNAGDSNIFVAIKGFKTDGHKFIKDCYKNGCRDFVIEDADLVNNKIINDSTVVLTDNSRRTLSEISNYINQYPFNFLRMIGVTGTKGKTSVVTLIHHFLNTVENTSMFSTVKNIVGGNEVDAVRTTMESCDLQRLLKKSADLGEKSAVVEVSSHAVTLYRIHGIQWDAGVFTSFSRDHLDLYGTMDKYFEAKLDFFKNINDSHKKNKFAVINIDDPKGEEVCSIINRSVRVIRVGTGKKADYKIEKYQIKNNGLEIIIKHKNNKYILKSRLNGVFNVINISLAVAASLELGIDIDLIKARLPKLKGIEGRFEIIAEKPFTIIIDYAHTPDSINKILEEARKLSKNRVICVFGCTGERDKDKRSIMGKIAALNTEYAIITNDDTYGEDPELIASDVEDGFKLQNKIIKKDYDVILDRKEAIKTAIKTAASGDVIVIAGMGHEKVQILSDGPVRHNDKEEVLKYLKN